MLSGNLGWLLGGAGLLAGALWPSFCGTPFWHPKAKLAPAGQHGSAQLRNAHILGENPGHHCRRAGIVDRVIHEIGSSLMNWILFAYGNIIADLC